VEEVSDLVSGDGNPELADRPPRRMRAG
jgi:hypothetical protein